jgi:predicted RecB family nuclease
MFSATDVANFLACQHVSALERAEARKEIKKPFFDDPTVEMLQRLGNEHEQRHLRQLEEDGLTIAKIGLGGSWESAVAETEKAIRSGADAIYQATFLDAEWRGRSDFLIRVNTRSELGDWSYEVVETKLARSTKAGAIVQLCFYSDLLRKMQGIEPQWMHVVLGGDAEPEKFSVQHYIAYFRKIRDEFEKTWKLDANPYPEPVEHCDVCPWWPVCKKRWDDDDYLSLVAGITRSQRKRLGERGIATVVSLAELKLPVEPRIERIGGAALQRIRDQAAIQVRGRVEGGLRYEFIKPIESERGLGILPPPSPQDVFLDLEANPYVLGQGLEYLIGFVSLPDADAKPIYESLWSFNRAQEKEAFETFIGKMTERRRQDGSMHIYHYASYEPTALKRLASRHGSCIEELDELLRGGVFIDLYRAVRQGVRASVESYSIKKLEDFYSYKREVPLRKANVSLNAFESALALGRRQDILELLDVIQGYNRDDCISTFLLRNWLEELRTKVGNERAEPLLRPAAKSGEAPEEVAETVRRVRELMARLVADLPKDDKQWDDDQRARWLLAQMLEYHRREKKSAYWEYFRLLDLSDDELQEDKNALGGLTYEGAFGTVKQSTIHRYAFPEQEYTIDRAFQVRDPKTKNPVRIFAIDGVHRTIEILRGIRNPAPHPTALVPYDIIKDDDLRESLFRLGLWVAEHGISGPGPHQAARDLLLRQRPSALTQPIESLVGEDGQLNDAARKLVCSLAEIPSVVPIQGPPGSGKTFTGSRMIVELVKNKRRVGITAVSHKVISKLLGDACEYAEKTGVTLRAIQKPNECDGCRHRAVTLLEEKEQDPARVLDALRNGNTLVAAGTSWLWSKQAMAGSVDVLFVDEAGQMSLANTLAISQAATSIVLLGDPQQLDQPQKGIHPDGADFSALSHLLNGHATIPAEQGIFLSETRRLHPDVCAFTSELFYDGRLVPRPENGKQRLNGQGVLDGTGLRFVPVDHLGNQNESQEEVETVALLLGELLRTGTTWTNKKGESIPLNLKDILIVSPYNAQVSALTKRLATGTRVGTVDKFQGQEAPIVFYSMATSSPDDAPRGMEFLYSLHRLNVATSRAQALCVVVASPRLLNPGCRSPRQMELANALCRYVELATVLPSC